METLALALALTLTLALALALVNIEVETEAAHRFFYSSKGISCVLFENHYR